ITHHPSPITPIYDCGPLSHAGRMLYIGLTGLINLRIRFTQQGELTYMVTKTLPARNEIATDYKWNLEAVFPQDTQWESEYAEVGRLLEQVKQYRGRLAESGATLLAALNLRNDITQRIERLFSYARMRRDEDNTNSHYQALADRARALWVRAE